MKTNKTARVPASVHTNTNTGTLTVHHSPPPPSAPRGPADALFLDPYRRVEPEFATLTEDQLAPINTDVSDAIGVATGALPAIRAIRPRIAQALPETNLACIDKLEDYTRALWYSNSAYIALITPSESLPALHAKATEVRNHLLTAAEPFADREVVSQDALAKIRAGNGYRDTADGVVSLVVMFRNKWHVIQGHTLVTLEELDEAATIADRLAAAAAFQASAASKVNEAASNRQRAFTLFIRAYDEVRRAVTYLRWHEGDLEKIAPSVYVRSPRTPKAAQPVTPAQPAHPAGSATTSAPLATPTAAHTVPQEDPFGRS